MTAETEKPLHVTLPEWLRDMGSLLSVTPPDVENYKAAADLIEQQSAEIARLEVEVSAYRNLPLYQTDRNWSSDDPNDTIELCVGCGMPGRGYHDGDETCPVAVIEALSALPGEGS